MYFESENIKYPQTLIYLSYLIYILSPYLNFISIFVSHICLSYIFYSNLNPTSY